MAISYKPLWKLLLDKDISKSELKQTVGLSPATIAKMGKDQYTSMDVLDRLCTHFNVQPSDIIEWKGSDE
jgi:putative transcriptional regulator